MSRQFFHIDLDDLVGELVYKDTAGKWRRVQVDLEPDRVRALIVSEKYDDMNAGAIGAESDVIALEDLKDDATRPHVEMWAARGMWGIPLEFKGAPKVAIPSLREVVEEAVEEAKPPRRTPNRSAK